MAADKAKNTLGQLKNPIALGSNPSVFKDQVSSKDKDDLYRFVLPTTAPRSSVDISLSGLKAKTNVDVELFALKGTSASVLKRIGRIDFSRLSGKQRNQNLTSIRRSANGSNLAENININLASGEYYLRVQSRKGTANYRLSIAANPDNAGETLTSARSISTGLLYDDYVGTSDPSDFYKFNVAQNSTAAVSLNNLVGNADVRLLDANGNQLGASANGGNTAETITTNLNTGDYYLEVKPAAGQSTTYRVGVTATPTGTPTPVPGATPTPTPGSTPLPTDGSNSPDTATPITVDFSRRVLSEFVNDSDVNDYYSFALANASKLDLKLTGLSADADIELLAADTSLVVNSINPGTTDEAIAYPSDPALTDPFYLLPAGSYYIHVFQKATGQNTAYQLEYSAPPLDRVGNDISNALDITTNLVGTSIDQPYKFPGDTSGEFVGGDDQDYFKFDVAAGGSFVSVALDLLSTGASGNADIRLLQQDGTNPPVLIASSNQSGNLDEAFGGNLGQGTYYLQVFPADAQQGNSYNLSLYTRPTNGVPTISRDINPGEANASVGKLTVVGNNKVFFVADDGNGPALWQADGSEQADNLGTLRSIKKVDLPATGPLTGIDNLVSGKFAEKDVLYFTNDRSVWRTDGAAPELLIDLSAATNVTGVSKPVDVNGTLYFVASRQNAPALLYRSDGTAANTVQITTNFANTIDQLTAIDVGTEHALYFSAATEATGRELWKLDNGTTTPQVIEVNPTTSTGIGGVILGDGSDPSDLFEYNNAIYFTAQGDNKGRELWKYDLSAQTSTRLTDLLTDSGNSFDEEPQFTVFQGNLYFTAQGFIDPTASNLYNVGKELWKLDVATQQVTLVADIGGDSGSSLPSNAGVSSLVADLTVAKDISGNDVGLYFTADDGTSGRELWRYTGGSSGPALVADLRTGGSSNPVELTIVNDTLYFNADGNVDGSGNSIGEVGAELWKLNTLDAAATPQQVSDILPGSDGSNPRELTAVLGRLFFVATNGSTPTPPSTVRGNGSELWVLG